MAQKDVLARGAQSARFSAGQASKDDPIEFHGTVAVEEAIPELVDVEQVRKILDFSKYLPMNNRVLLRKVIEESDSVIVQPEQWARIPNKAEVLAIPAGCGELEVGDLVLYGEYNAEDIEVEGEKLLLVDLRDVRMKILA